MTSSPRTDIDFQALFDAAPGIYLVLDAAFNMVAANEARLKATMTTREEIIGRNLFEVFPDNPDDPAADGVRNLRLSLERVLQTKQPDAMAVQKYDIPRPDAQGGGFEVRYWSPLNSPVLGENGELKYIIHRVEDVTDFMRLKQQEAQLQSHADRIENEIYKRAQEVQEANRKFEAANTELQRLYTETQDLAAAQQRFFSQVSHELRTPLTLILGPVEQLLSEHSGVSAQHRRDLESIARNARSLLRHVNDLLDVAKYTSGTMSVAYARTDLAERLRVAVAHFDSASTGRALSLVVDAPQMLEAEVEPEKIDRILINLLSNAFKFTPDGGQIRCTLKSDGNDAVFSVADTGPGVAPHLREAVFEPFRQGDEGLTRRSSGTGLGLAIVRDFVVLHGGVISVRDAPGGGALFECRLPLRAPAGVKVAAARATLDEWNFRQAAETQIRRAPAAQRAAGAEDALVLVVEDNPDMVQFIVQTLAPSYRIATASNGAEGLREAERLKPDVIVSDLMMPEMSGDQLVAALAQHEDLRETPVLLLTARADEETRVEALRQGAQDFLAKPFSVEELLARVGNLIRTKQAGDAARRGRRISEEKYSQLMDRARDAVFILTGEGVILDANRRAEDFAGRSGQSLAGLRLDQALGVRAANGAALDIESSAIIELETAEERAEDRRFFEATSAGVAVDGETYRLVIVRDVSEQRRVEGQLRRMQKLDALGQLTGGIAHDFNNLLTVVTANTEALILRLRDRPDAAALAANIERAADSGSSMTRRLLAFARQQPVEVRLCDINEAVTTSVEMLRRTLPSTIIIDPRLTLGAWPALVDESQLQDALVNLAINARDAMPSGGRLIIETANTHSNGHGGPTLPPGDYVQINVSDTGAGMSNETLQRVFEPFFTTKPEGKGTGLGLAQVYGFVRQAGGDVSIESTLGRGTRITLMLPRGAASAAAAAASG